MVVQRTDMAVQHFRKPRKRQGMKSLTIGDIGSCLDDSLSIQPSTGDGLLPCPVTRLGGHTLLPAPQGPWYYHRDPWGFVKSTSIKGGWLAHGPDLLREPAGLAGPTLGAQWWLRASTLTMSLI